MTDFSNLILLNHLREKGVAVVRTPGGIVAHGLWRLSQSEQQMFYRLTQKELSDALRIQKA